VLDANTSRGMMLRRLPGQLLLSLINGTSILVIVAAILVIVASQKVTHLAHDVATTMTNAALVRVGGRIPEIGKNLESASENVRALADVLKQLREDRSNLVDPYLLRLDASVDRLTADMRELKETRSMLVDALITKIGLWVSDGLRYLWVCSAKTETRSPQVKWVETKHNITPTPPIAPRCGCARGSPAPYRA
jgi:hypothetical protein